MLTTGLLLLLPMLNRKHELCQMSQPTDFIVFSVTAKRVWPFICKKVRQSFGASRVFPPVIRETSTVFFSGLTDADRCSRQWESSLRLGCR